MKYKVKVSKWFLENKSNPDAKLPVKVNGKIELIGKPEDEVITDNIQGIENDPRFIIEPIKKEKKKEEKPEKIEINKKEEM